VVELDGYQRVIDGARQVAESWKPQVKTDTEWPMVELGEVSVVVRGSSPRPQGDSRYYGGSIPRLMVADVTRDGMYTTPRIDSLTKEGAKKSRPMKKGDLIMAVSGQPGLCTILNVDACIHDGFVGFRNLKSEKVLTEFAYYCLMSQKDINSSLSTGAVFKNLTTDQLKKFKIPAPPISQQRRILTEIDAEQRAVEACRELIVKHEAKIAARIGEAWGS
jgi:restriction endonuclease S subunit